MQGLNISIDEDMADQFMIAMLRNTADTAIWCIRQAHQHLTKGGGPHIWTDISDNLKILGAANELLEYHGAKPLDLVTHVAEKPI